MQLINDQLTEERAVKTSIEQRGVAVITTSGGLVTLLFGLSALATKNQAYVLPDLARGVLILAVLLFASASVVALMTNQPRRYTEVTPKGLRDLVEPDRWSDEPAEAGRLAAEARVDIVDRARANNGDKAALLRAAMALEVTALAALAFAVGDVLATR